MLIVAGLSLPTFNRGRGLATGTAASRIEAGNVV